MSTRTPKPSSTQDVDKRSQKRPTDNHQQQTQKQKQDEELDKELDETFPASDPLPWSHEVK